MGKIRQWYWDLESTDWDQPLCTAAVRDDGETVTFWGGDCLERIGELMDQEGGQWCAHFGGGYDVPLLFQYSDVPRARRLIMSGSVILNAECRQNLKLRDTFPATLASLAKIGKWVGLEKLEMDRGNLQSADPAEVLRYNVRDCEILKRGVEGFQGYLAEQGAKNAWTAGGAAISLLKALEPGGWRMLRRNLCEGAPMVHALGGVRGGRVESWARGYLPDVYSYDFKSSYPARYANQTLGIGLRRASSLDRVGLFKCRWYWPDRKRRPPALDALTGAGAGHCENWLVGEEIAAFERRGVKVEMIEGWAPKTQIPIGQVFAETMYAQKEAGSPWAKVFLNSLHGKFSERPIKDAWTRDYPGEYWGPAPRRHGKRGGGWWSYLEMKLDKNGLGPPHAQPIAAGQILGRARVALFEVFEALEEAGWDVYYCDTDSVHTNCPPDRFPIALGDEKIGDLALEAGPVDAIYLGPKAYILRDKDTGEIVKSALKGVPLRAMADGVVDRSRHTGKTVYRQARETEKGEDLRWELFREASEYQWGVQVQKAGVSSFVWGLKKRRETWGKVTSERTIRATGRGKTFEGHRHPAWWRYLTPSECGEVVGERPVIDSEMQYEWTF